MKPLTIIITLLAIFLCLLIVGLKFNINPIVFIGFIGSGTMIFSTLIYQNDKP